MFTALHYIIHNTSTALKFRHNKTEQFRDYGFVQLFNGILKTPAT